jgi:hypothetical protein
MDYNSAIRAAIKNVAADGLNVIDYASGHQDKLDVAMRRNILTGVAQTAGQLQITRADEMGSDLVGVSAHVGARNKGGEPENHEMWQGKVYSRSGNHPKYGNFYQHTGYGTGPGLAGWNCRHSFYPFFEGLSENAYTREDLQDYANKTVTYQGKEIPIYDATQYQREIERRIRFWKRQAGALDAAGLENAAETAKVREWQARARDFVKQTGLDRQYPREQVLEYTRKAITPKARSKAIETPKLTETGALGVPVSNALDTERIKNSAMRDQIDLAFREMDKVHGDGELPKIPLVESTSKREFGSYWSSGIQSLRIKLSKTGNHQALTLLHEIGHFLDHRGFGLDNVWSSRSKILNGIIVQAAKNSKWYKDVWKRFLELNTQISKDVPPFQIGRKYVNYLLSDKELYARSYAQYIAVKSGDKILLDQLRKLQSAKFTTQWDDKDFQPIMEAFDELFKSKGWMK